MEPSQHNPEKQSLRRLPAPVPPNLAETFGYSGDARFVAFHHEPYGDELFFDDGRSAGTGEWYPFKRYREHPATAVFLQDCNLGGSDLEAEHWLLVDRELEIAYTACVATARSFLEEQHPPQELVELTPYEVEEAQRQLQEMIAESLRQMKVSVDAAQIQQRMEEQHRAVTEMVAYLDQSIDHTNRHSLSLNVDSAVNQPREFPQPLRTLIHYAHRHKLDEHVVYDGHQYLNSNDRSPVASFNPDDNIEVARLRRHNCEYGRYPWDHWHRWAIADGVQEDLADLGRSLIREADQHNWSPQLQAECGWEDSGAAMLSLALNVPDDARARWNDLMKTDGDRVSYDEDE